MKIVVRALCALAVLALATPAFACDGAKKTTMASSEKATTPAAKATAQAEKKADAKAKTAQAQQQVKAATAAN